MQVVLVQADNVLTPAVLQRMLKLHQAVEAITVNTVSNCGW